MGSLCAQPDGGAARSSSNSSSSSDVLSSEKRDALGGELMGDGASSEAGCSLVSACACVCVCEREWYVRVRGGRIRLLPPFLR